MNEHSVCTMEREILLAAATDRWNGSLTDHLSICADCRSSVEIAGWLNQLANIPVNSAPPDPEVIWMMSRLAQSSHRSKVPSWEGIVAMFFAACIAVIAWSPLQSLIGKAIPLHSMLLVMFLVSCIVAGGMTIFALTSGSLFSRQR